MDIHKGVLLLGDFEFLYQGSHNQFDYLSGVAEVEPATVSKFNDAIRSRKEWCDENAYSYLHVVFPSKPVVLADYIMAKGISIESLFLRSNYGTDYIIYPLDDLVPSNVFKHDTHLNDEGSVVVLRKILDYLGYDANFVANYEVATKVGDLSVMRSLTSRKELFNKYIGVEGGVGKNLSVDNVSGVKGNSGRIVITRNPFAIHNKKVLIFGDSYFFNMIAMLSDQFSEVVFIRSPSFCQYFVSQYQPDLILTGNAERYLSAPVADLNGGVLMRFFDSDFFDADKVSDEYKKAFYCIFSGSTSIGRRWRNNIDADLFRDYAISLEGVDLVLALNWMLKAQELRPSGPYINKKVLEYTKAIECRCASI